LHTSRSEQINKDVISDASLLVSLLVLKIRYCSE